MRKKSYERRTAEFLEEPMTPEKEAAFAAFLRETGSDPSILPETKNLLAELERIDVPEPSPAMSRKFYAMLGDAKKDLRRSAWSAEKRAGLFPKLAYGLSLLVLGIVIGSRLLPGQPQKDRLSALVNEIQDMKKSVLLAMLSKPSASDRIKAVQISQEIIGLDEKVTAALLDTLNNDPNVNVRLVAVETLSGFAKNPRVREGLVESIGTQESPAVQLALADLMLALNEKRAVSQFEKLLENKSLDSGIKRRLEDIRSRLI
jgi:hypothetical protein